MTEQELEIQQLRRMVEQLQRENDALKALRQENAALRIMHQLDLAEIIRLRRWMGAMEEEKHEQTTD